MNKIALLIILLVITLIVSAVLLTNSQLNISSQKKELFDLNEKISIFQKEISDLEDEKIELENKIKDLTKINNNSVTPRPNDTGIRNKEGFASVVYRAPSCDYFILENESGYIIAEWFGGSDPNLNDKITGSINSFGFKDLYNITRGNNCRFWIDDYMLSKEDALDKIKEKCN